VLELLCQRQVEIVDRLVYFRRVLIANRHAIHPGIPERELHCGLAVCTLGERALAHQLHADYAHSILADLLHMCNHFVYISQAGGVVVFGIHPHALMIHPDHGNFQPLVFRHPAQRGESMNRRAVRQHSLFGLSFGNSILPSEAVGWPGRCMLPVQKDYVEVVGFGGLAQLVDFFLRIDAVMGRDLGHQPIAIARNSLQGDSQHLVHSTVRFGSLKEADTALVGMAYQPGELLLSQVALYLTRIAARTEGEPGHLYTGFSQRYPIRSGLTLRFQREASGTCERTRGESGLDECTSGVVSHDLPPLRRILPQVIGTVPGPRGKTRYIGCIMKKFINRPENVVEEMLQGLVVLHPGCVRLPEHKVLIRADAEQGRQQVALLSGGGSGHEPAHAGYIGAGMLSGAIAGEVFTSPSSDAVFAAIQAVAGKPGALLVVKNYTGDRLNFGLAAEMARAQGIPVEMLIVDDDVALKGMGQATGARGLAGTVFIHKLVGAAAAEGRSLAEVAALGKAAVDALATMGVSFSAGTSPAVGRPSFELGESEMELGLGIHGEPGVKRMQLQPADELTETLLRQILQHGKFGSQKRVAVMINNLGATTAMELAIIGRHAVSFLEREGFVVKRIYAGTFLSALDMAGISISVLGLDDDRLRWIDAATTAPAWPNVLKRIPGKPAVRIATAVIARAISTVGSGAQTEMGKRTKQAIEAACRALIAAEGELTEMDRVTGDGDLGASMTRAATAVLDAANSYPLDDIPATLKSLGHSLGRELGGSSGPLYAVLFLRCGSVLEVTGPTGLAQWVEALDQGCQAISELGGAKPGDRTMLDALDPFVKTLLQDMGAKAMRELVRAAVEASEHGVEATAQMKPRMGRSSYLGDRVLGHPDPGAKAISLWLRAVCESLFPIPDAKI
jgi:triose/dihydroxyacetone kinase / FAD-AMP lyase (cyclizing)